MINNDANIPLYLAAWLANDEYDYVSDPKYISATSLMKPTKELILSGRVPPEVEVQTQLSDLIPSSLGNSIHAAVENVWLNDKLRSRALARLGYPQEEIDAIEVNPTKPDPNKISLYIEQRTHKKILGYTIGGKYDAVLAGLVHDLKTTSAFSWIYGTRDQDYIIQGSIYRWLNPDKITEDFVRISLVFTDWTKSSAKSNPSYPDCRIKHLDLPLMSEVETEKWVRNKVQEIIRYKDAPEDEMPRCTESDVWLSDAKYRYYANPEKTTRATRVFDSEPEAAAHLLSAGKGIVIASTRYANKCSKYCSAYPVCEQAKEYNHPEE